MLTIGDLLLAEEKVEHLSAFKVSSLFSKIVSCLNIDEASLSLGEFDAFRLRCCQADLERDCVNFVFIFIFKLLDLAVRHFDLNALLNYTRSKFNLHIFDGDEILVSNGSLLALDGILVGISINEA